MSKKIEIYVVNILKIFVLILVLEFVIMMEIDSMNILNATHKGNAPALNNLSLTPDMIDVDGNGFTDYYNDDNRTR